MDNNLIDHRHCKECGRVIYRSLDGNNIINLCELCKKANGYCDYIDDICQGTNNISGSSGICVARPVIRCEKPKK